MLFHAFADFGEIQREQEWFHFMNAAGQTRYGGGLMRAELQPLCRASMGTAVPGHCVSQPHWLLHVVPSCLLTL